MPPRLTEFGNWDPHDYADALAVLGFPPTWIESPKEFALISHLFGA